MDQVTSADVDDRMPKLRAGAQMQPSPCPAVISTTPLGKQARGSCKGVFIDVLVNPVSAL
jgi:hypothetical protein